MPGTSERLERALFALAHFVELDGEVYLPLFALVEEELKAARQQSDTRERARALLANYTSGGGLRAIR